MKKKDIIKAAKNAFLLGIHDHDSKEVLVHGRLVKVEELDSSWTKRFNNDGYDFVSQENPAIEVEYEVWVLPDAFDAVCPDKLIYRRERAIIDASTLTRNEVVVRGMSWELCYLSDHYELLDEIDGPALSVGLPEQLYERYLSIICSDRHDEILDYFESDEDGTIPDGLPGSLSDFYRRVRKGLRKSQLEISKRFDARQAERDLAITSIQFDVSSPAFEIDGAEVSLVLRSKHDPYRLIIEAAPSAPSPDVWDVKVRLGKLARGASSVWCTAASIEYSIPDCPSTEVLQSSILKDLDKSILSELEKSVASR